MQHFFFAVNLVLGKIRICRESFSFSLKWPEEKKDDTDTVAHVSPSNKPTLRKKMCRYAKPDTPSYGLRTPLTDHDIENLDSELPL